MYGAKPKLAWALLRDAVDADDTTLETFEYENETYEDNKYVIPDDASSIIIAAFGKAAADKDVAYILWGRHWRNGPIEKVAEGVITLGTMVVTKHPITKVATTQYWADTITNVTTSSEWVKTPVIKNSGKNGICYFCLDDFALKDLYLEIDLDGGDGDAMTEISAIITGTNNN